MLDDKDIEYNMILYMGIMNEKYKESRQKFKYLQKLINNSVKKIQKYFRKWIRKKKLYKVCILQKWWKYIFKNNTILYQKIFKFKKFYYGLIILFFFKKVIKKKQLAQNNKKNQNNLQIIKQKKKFKLTCLHIRAVVQYFHSFILRKSALITQQRYIGKYREYLRKRFNENWQKYEKKISKQLLQQIDKKWIKIPIKSQASTQKNQKLYYNFQDKQINVDQYIQTKLDKLYEQNYGRLQITQNKLKNDQMQIYTAIMRLENQYRFNVRHYYSNTKH